jgi:hypothetical protein
MEVKKLKLPEVSVPRPQDEFDTPPAVGGGLPLPVGRPVTEVMIPKNLTEVEKRALSSVNVKEGQPIPVDMARRLEEARAEMKASGELEPDARFIPDVKPIKIHEVEFDDLPDAHKSKLGEALRQASEISKGPGPGMDAPPLVAGLTVEVTDDVSGREEPEDKSDLVGINTGSGPEFCPHCNWDMSMKDIPDPDESTKLWYLQAILGNKPFEKLETVMGGAVGITFRELTIKQNDAIYAKAGREVKKDEVSTVDRFIEIVRRYRLAMQLKSLRLGETLIEIPNDFDPQGDGADAKLSMLLDLIETEVLKNVTITNVVARAMDRFNRTISKLEAGADSENFWPAV